MRIRLLALSVCVFGLANAAHAATDLVTNGGFETTTNGNGQLNYNTVAAGWTEINDGYSFVFAPGTADTTGAVGQFGRVWLWGPGEHDGVQNGLTTSPDGGNFVALSGNYNTQPLQQTITGLVAGKSYDVSFYYAGAQQYGYNGATTDQLGVSLGGQTQDTQVLHDVNHGFTGWMHETMVFTATGSSEVLSFLANSTPVGTPPYALLDGVSVTAVPEPATWAMMILGVGGIGGLARLRRRTALAI
jgi:hypothetical protein